jgi:hypothetical protein
MPRSITRRAVARLLIAGPATVAFPSLVRARPSAAPKGSRPALSAGERSQMEKSVKQLQDTAAKLRKVPVPMGYEPAFVFHAILPKR